MKKTTAIVALGLAASVSLTGCSGLKDALSNRHELTYDDYASASAGWAAIPSWIPTDAAAIRLRETTNAPVAVVQLLTDSEAVDCATANRRYIPGIGGDWIPTDYPHSVLRCGDWEVMSINGGWFGWTISETDMVSHAVISTGVAP
jgi:hypothetical protein